MQDVLPVSGAKKLLAKCFAARNGACWARNRRKEPNIGICKVGLVVLKSASPQVFFFAPQRKLRFSKAQLGSMRLKLLDATFHCNFYECIWYAGICLDWLF
jgi:hypothetical protein